MANLFTRLRHGAGDRERDISLQGYADLVNNYLNGAGYGGYVNTTYGATPQQEMPATYIGFAERMYRSNPVVLACMDRRMSLFSEARFKWRQIRQGQPGDLFGNPDLAILEQPWPNGTTTDLLARAIQDVDLAGNFYCVRDSKRLYRLRPDWVTIILGSRLEPVQAAYAPDVEILGYLYRPPMGEPREFMVQEVAHWAPRPDPLANFRGFTWLEAALREVMGHDAMTTHHLKYFENGATPNIVVEVTDPNINPAGFERWIKAFNNDHEGLRNAYRTMYLAKAHATVVGGKMEDFQTVKGHAETLIAAAAGVPAVIAGLSEGLEGSSLNAGNFGAAKRLFSDGTMRPLWRSMCQAMSTIMPVPNGAELWYDVSDIPFLAEDQLDKSAILEQNSNVMHTLVAAGFEPDSVVTAVTSGDLTALVHSGLYSVQLQPAGAVTEGKGALVSGVSVPTKPAPKAAQANSAPVLQLLSRVSNQETN